ncbi:hypothetical protein HTZ84_03425 [Haloterrigena sp. SYSU A558-1]|uniref:Uncharacterized protein n=1 Tax=Haloterrigena gelatinilytica TaxID=2741724 RepID=A0A8J8GP17_9EURY|nr:hypothetical protein [Haloterrigena gelatinilytica]NUB92718.1 hypothetical protein [Haloterrigena gelatinilytica]NUC71367.1 hypothetical protein [Haloterrigena gelatinilytica]
MIKSPRLFGALFLFSLGYYAVKSGSLAFILFVGLIPALLLAQVILDRIESDGSE